MNQVNMQNFRHEIQFQIEEAANFLGVSMGKVEVWARTGMLKCYKIGEDRFIHRSDLESFMGKCRGFKFVMGQQKRGVYVKN